MKEKITKIISNAILVPLISVFLLNKINILSYFTFIPIDKQFDIGLICYMAFFGTVFEVVLYLVNQRKVTVECIFYNNINEKSLQNTPAVICRESAGGVAYVQCGIKLIGNIKRLKTCQVTMNLPKWVTVQIGQDDQVASYCNNDLVWDFSNIISLRGTRNQSAEYDSQISFIRNQSDNTLRITVKPTLNGKNFWHTFGIKFVTNSVNIINKE